MGVTKPSQISAASVDSLFQNSAKKRKGEFALELAAQFAERRENDKEVSVPDVVASMFDFLYGGAPMERPPDNDAPAPD